MPLKKKKPEEKPAAPLVADLDAARVELAASYDSQAGGDVNSPNEIAGHALNLFDKYRYLPAFQAIAEALVRTAK